MPISALLVIQFGKTNTEFGDLDRDSPLKILEAAEGCKWPTQD
jgi:hypothetical protein